MNTKGLLGRTTPCATQHNGCFVAAIATWESDAVSPRPCLLPCPYSLSQGGSVPCEDEPSSMDDSGAVEPHAMEDRGSSAEAERLGALLSPNSGRIGSPNVSTRARSTAGVVTSLRTSSVSNCVCVSSGCGPPPDKSSRGAGPRGGVRERDRATTRHVRLSVMITQRLPSQ